MTPTEVRRLVEDQIGGQWDRSNLHGVDLRTCLLDPKHTECIDVSTGQRINLWLVLSEAPGSDSCYGVAYEEASNTFGLVEFSPTMPPVLVGMYGGFLDAMEAM